MSEQDQLSPGKIRVIVSDYSTSDQECLFQYSIDRIEYLSDKIESYRIIFKKLVFLQYG